MLSAELRKFRARELSLASLPAAHGAAILLLAILGFAAHTVRADTMSFRVDSGASQVPVGQPITLQVQIVNEDFTSEVADIGTGIYISVNGEPVSAGTGGIVSRGCSVDNDPRATGSWACGRLAEGRSETVEFDLNEPQGIYRIDVRGFYQNYTSGASGINVGTYRLGPFVVGTPMPEMSVQAQGSVAEGDSGTSNLVFNVVIFPSYDAGPVTVNYTTADGSATAGSDYVATSGTLTIPPGQTLASIAVPIVGDVSVETNETFTVTLSNPAGATLVSASSVTGTIVNDDGAKIAGGNRTIADDDATPGVSAEFSATDIGNVNPATLVWTVTSNGATVDTVEGSATARLKLNAGDNAVSLGARGNEGATIALAEVQVSVGQPGQIAALIPGLSAPAQEVARGLTVTCSHLQAADSSSLTAGQANLLDTCDKVFEAVNAGDSQTVQQVLEQVSGKQVTTLQRLGIDFSAAQLTNIAARTRALRRGARGFSTAGLNLQGVGDSAPWGPLRAMARDLLGLGGGASADDAVDAFGGRLGVFVNGNLRFGNKDRTERESGFDFHTLGLTFGADYRLGDRLFLGGAMGYGKSATDFDSTGGALDSKSRELSLFGTWYASDFYIDWIGSYGQLGHDSVRNINLPQLGIADVARGATDGTQWAASLSSGYSLHRGGWTLEPSVSVSYVGIEVDDFTEREDGASGLALGFPEQRGDSLTVKAAGQFGYVFSFRWGLLLPQLRIDFTREFRNDGRPITVFFANDVVTGPPGSPRTGFVVFTDAPDRGYFHGGASVVAQFTHGIAAFVDYERTAGLRTVTSTGISAGLRMETSF